MSQNENHTYHLGFIPKDYIPVPDTWVVEVGAQTIATWTEGKRKAAGIVEVVNSQVSDKVVNEKGAKQSRLSTRFDLLPPRALRVIAETLHEGSHYDEGRPYPNYLDISATDHLNHALAHVMLHLQGDTSEKHMAHALTRLMFYVEVTERAKVNTEDAK